MLAKAGEGVAQALRALGSAPAGALAEFKYDGMRAQVHMAPGGQVWVFSRNCEDRTAAFPDVVQQVRDAAAGGAASLILDAEVVAVDRGAQRAQQAASPPAGEAPEDAAPGAGGVRLRSFQELASRPRAGVKAEDLAVPICVFAFDLLYADGEALQGLPLAERRRRLEQVREGALPGAACDAA